MEKSIYAQPIGMVGLSRVDVRDIAEAAVQLLTHKRYDSRAVNLVGPDVLTGERAAQIWSESLNTPISYTTDTMDVWEQKARKIMPDYIAYEFRKMYDFFQKEGLKAIRRDVKELTQLLGHEPRAYASYVEQTVREWRKAAAS